MAIVIFLAIANIFKTNNYERQKDRLLRKTDYSGNYERLKVKAVMCALRKHIDYDRKEHVASE